MHHLSLNNTMIGDAGLEHLAGLRDLGRVYLDKTQVSEAGLIHLAGLEDLEFLDLDNTQVRDLRPLLEFASAREKDGNRSLDALYFRNTPALALDDTLRELSKVEDPSERTFKTLAYLEEVRDDWLPGSSGLGNSEAGTPEDRPSGPLHILPEDGPVHSVDVPPAGGDADQDALRQDLIEKANQLIETIGQSNELAPLRGQVEHYRARLTAEEIRIKLLWSAFNTLRQTYEADDRAEESHRSADLLPPEVSAALKDLVETHGLFAMGFENAAALERQMREGVTGERNRQLLDAAREVVAVLADHPEAIAQEDYETLQDEAEAAKGSGPSAEMAENDLNNRLWNMLGAVGRKARTWVVRGVGGGGAALLAHDFIQFLLGNETIVMTYLRIAQGSAAEWFPNLMTAIRALLGL